MRRPSGRSLTVAAALLVWGAAGSCNDGSDTAFPSTTSSASTTTTTTTTNVPAYRSETYADAPHWVCRPDTDDVCDDGLDSTDVAADGSVTVHRWQPATEAPIDCFYVYPTISGDSGTNSDLVPSDAEEGFVAVNQVARLGQVCRVFAPVYRQLTFASVSASIAGGPAPSADAAAMAYADVLDAWRQYLANDNGGRGVVLVGHSQGAALLTQLIAEQIDPDPAARSLLVSAFLAGTVVQVPDGADVGGTFAHVALCRSVDQTGCVVTWASYRATMPPTGGALFGRDPEGGVAGCTNPASLAGGSGELHSFFAAAPSNESLAMLGTASDGKVWVDPAVATVATPFVSLPGMVSGTCVSRHGFSYLEISVDGRPDDPRTDDINGDVGAILGLHLQDLNLVMGDVVSLVERQAKAYADR